MAKPKIKNMSMDELLGNIPSMPRESIKRVIDLHGDNSEIMVAVLKFNGAFLEYCNDRCKSNKELVAVAVAQTGMALSYADSSLRKDSELVKIALHTTPFALRIADVGFKTDIDYVQMATDADIRTIQYASLDIRNNYVFIRDLLLRDGQAYPYIGPELMTSKVLAYIAISTCSFGYHLTESLNGIANLLKPDISMLLEVAHIYHKLNKTSEWHISKRTIPQPDRPLLKFVLETDVDDSAWIYVRQAILLNPEPFINPDHILRQIMQTPDDWKPIAESILYDDFLKFNCTDSTKINVESLPFELIL